MYFEAHYYMCSLKGSNEKTGINLEIVAIILNLKILREQSKVIILKEALMFTDVKQATTRIHLTPPKVPTKITLGTFRGILL